ncbi:MAG: cation-translocating P-type ATPase [Saprospiraceae bacterium]
MEKEMIALEVDGMDCSNCAASISRFLERKGLEEVFVNFQTKEVRFVRNDERLTLEQARKGIEKLGYTIVEKEQPLAFWTLEKKLLISALCTLPLLLSHVGMAIGWHWESLHNPWVQLALTLPPFIIGVTHFGSSAMSSLRGGVPNMDVLIFIGSTAAFMYSLVGLWWQNPDYYFFETTATIITLVLLGNWMEHRAVARTTSAIGELTRLQAEKARRIMPSGTLVEIPRSELKKDMLVQINEGDIVPSDAIVEQGETFVDESMLTGESMPVAKTIGAELIGGSLLQQGHVQARIIAVGKDTVLSQMVELVKTAQQDKPPIQQLADKVSAIFVPVVVGIALLTFLVSYWGLGIPAGQALLNAIAVLVISCPCAMGLATPTAVMVGVGRLAQMGVLIKGGRTVEQLAGIRQLVFDKTGTLTTGNFRLEGATYFTKEEPLANAIAWTMEQHSNHPIARSLYSELAQRPRAEALPALIMEEVKGIGMSARTEDGETRYTLGGARILPNALKDTSGDIFLLRNETLMAAWHLGDDLKTGMEATIAALHEQGIGTAILSGDQKHKTRQLAERIGINEWYGEQLPAEKLAVIENLATRGAVAMVGDGINDAPALAKADLGISLSNASSVAIQSAKVVLLNGRIDVLPQAMALSRKTVQTIRQNLFWAFAYNIVAIPIAAAGYLNPMWAALFMAFSDVIVIGNSLLLRYK